MSKIKPMALIESMSGNVCMHSDVYFRTNKRSGQVSTGKLCHPFKGEPSTDQLAQRTKFATAVASAKTILHATAPTGGETASENYTKLQSYQASYKSHPTYGGSLYSWILKGELNA
mgnify:CR=1 FL=1